MSDIGLCYLGATQAFEQPLYLLDTRIISRD
jgi:hypothetical protein